MTDLAAKVAYTTPAEFAEQLGKSEAWVMARCRSKKWPHLGVGKSVRFTPDHIAMIERLLTVEPSEQVKADDSWGRKGRA